MRGGVGNTLIPPGVPRQPPQARGLGNPNVMSMVGQGGSQNPSNMFNPINRTPLPINPRPTQQTRPMVPPANAQPRNITTDPNVVERNFLGMPQGGDQGRFGMSGFFNRLFNDPARMAMLSGG